MYGWGFIDNLQIICLKYHPTLSPFESSFHLDIQKTKEFSCEPTVKGFPITLKKLNENLKCFLFK